jgi:uncharacterized small protein (DUF1192 family)
MPDINWSPSMRWFMELLAARLEIKLLQREIDELKAQLAQRDARHEA